MLGLVQETVVTRWRADPWSRGSYSYVSTGSQVILINFIVIIIDYLEYLQTLKKSLKFMI